MFSLVISGLSCCVTCKSLVVVFSCDVPNEYFCFVFDVCRFKRIHEESRVNTGQNRFQQVMKARTGASSSVTVQRRTTRGRGSRGANRRGGSRGGRGGRGRRGGKGAPSQEALDKELDSYMMKDPKSAMAKLDEELDSYMEGQDVEMAES